LAPLTIFTGVNSSGKSSFLHSIAMLKQSVNKGDYNLTGDLVDLGDFRRIYCQKAAEYEQDQNTKEIDIQFTISSEDHKSIYVEQKLKMDEDDEAKISLDSFSIESRTDNKDNIYLKYSKTDMTKIDEISFDEIKQGIKFPGYINSDINSGEIQTHFSNSFIPDKISFFLKYTDEQIGEFIKILAKIPSGEDLSKLLDSYSDPFGEDTYPMYGYDDMPKIWFHNNITSSKFFDGFTGPAYYVRVFAAEHFFETLFSKFYRRIKSRGIKDNFPDMFSLRSIFSDKALSISDWYLLLSETDEKEREIIKEEITKNGGKIIKEFMGNDYETPAFDLPVSLKKASNELEEYFNHKIKYLGPLREDPKWSYESGFDEDINVKGSNSLSYFLRHCEETIEYISPKGINSSKFSLKKANLDETLNEWLNYIGIATRQFIMRGKPNIKNPSNEQSVKEKYEFAITLFYDGGIYAIPQLGTGVSQVLPVLLMCLTAPPGSTIIIQEPEQALHPKMQSRLADFFIVMALSGRQCIIETHSEHIIEKLRLRIAVEENENIRAKTKIYFAEKKDGKTEFEEIEINECGAIMNWPDDFFDESSKWADDMNKAASEKWEKNNKD